MKIELDNPTVKKWIKGETIVNSFWDESQENLRIVSKNDDLQYTLYRFFYLGNIVQCSIDIKTCREEMFIRNLMGCWLRNR